MISEKLIDLKIEIPNAPNPVGAYVAFKKVNNLLYISGQLPIDSNGTIIKGKIGKELDVNSGYKAAERCALSIISQVKKACGDELLKVKLKVELFLKSLYLVSKKV